MGWGRTQRIVHRDVAVGDPKLASMKSTPFDPVALDVAALAAAGASVSACWPLNDLTRLHEDEAPEPGAPAGEIHCDARGELMAEPGAAPQVWLHLDIRAGLWRTCQRCLRPVQMPMHVRRALRFVAGEEAAAALDAESDDDVLALERHIDLRVLAEDELLLSLPLVPLHESCAGLAVTDSQAEFVSPFAVLAGLKRTP